MAALVRPPDVQFSCRRFHAMKMNLFSNARPMPSCWPEAADLSCWPTGTPTSFLLRGSGRIGRYLSNWGTNLFRTQLALEPVDQCQCMSILVSVRNERAPPPKSSTRSSDKTLRALPGEDSEGCGGQRAFPRTPKRQAVELHAGDATRWARRALGVKLLGGMGRDLREAYRCRRYFRSDLSHR